MSIEIPSYRESTERHAKPPLEGKVAVVTGAARGIGQGIARVMADNGATVVLSDILTEQGKASAAEIGGSAEFMHCDITSPSEVYSLMAAVVRTHGKLDVMVNNAGVNSGDPLDRVGADQYPIETWQRLINTNLNGTFYCCKAAAAHMVEQGFGSIVNIASVAGVVALRLQIGYVSTKAAILKMTEAMACELAPKGVRVNAISPGSILTDGTRTLFYANRELSERVLSFIPQGRPGECEDVANAVVYLASDAAGYVNGHNLVVDGGWTCGFNRDF